MQSYTSKLVLLLMTVFSIAMGFLESSVVVYLREIFYPRGFAFPLTPMTGHIALTELLREASTIVMLITVSVLAGKNARQKFALFLYSFAIWDIFYYVFLKVLIHWPESFFTWDILFLIPVIWTGPVITPVLVSGTMILMAIIIFHYEEKVTRLHVDWSVSALIIAGSVLVFTAFIWDFTAFLVRDFSLSALFEAGISHTIIQSYIPSEFNWLLFLAGEVVILTGIYRLLMAYQHAAENR